MIKHISTAHPVRTAVSTAAVTFAAFAFATGAAAADLIIGAPLSTTGPAGGVGTDAARGAQVAVNEINAAGGVLGNPLKLEVQDTAGAPAQAVQLFGSFARNPDVVAVLGPVNAAEVGAVTRLAETRKLVAFTPTSAGSVPGVPDQKFNPWTFRINQAQSTVLGPLLEAAIKKTGAQSATIINYSDSPPYVDAANLWAKTAEANKLPVQRIQFPSTTQDYAAIVTQIQKSTGIIVLGMLSESGGPLIRAIRQSGLTAPIVGDASVLTSSVYAVSQGMSKGTYSYSSYLKGFGTGAEQFVSAYKKAHGADPSAIAAYGYDAVKLIANAMVTQKAVTRQAVRDGLGATKNYAGVTGMITYADSGDAIRTSVPLVQVDEGGALKQIGDIDTSKKTQ